MTVNEVAEMIDTLKAAYPRMEQFSDDNVKTVWLKAFENLDGTRTMKAVWVCIKKYEFMPSIAQVIKEYEDILAEEKHEQGEIKRFYEQARSYYPGCGEYGYGWKEFSERAKTKEEAENLQNLIIGYVNYIDRETDAECIDFAECVKRVTRHPCEGIYIAKLPLKQPRGEAKR